MGSTTLVELHCHSNLSDGYFSPETLVDRLAAEGVRYAALTDHDSLEGDARFRAACARKGIGSLTGLEVTATWQEREIHLLAYGFDPDHAALQPILQATREGRRSKTQPVTQRLGRLRTAVQARNELSTAIDPKLAPPGFEEICRIMHDAGGRVFLAHPFSLASEEEGLEAQIVELKALGLDGVEAFYKPYRRRDRGRLADIAHRNGLLVSAGSDYHGNETPVPATPGLPMPTSLWKQFRDALGEPGPARQAGNTAESPRTHHMPWRGFFLRILMPTLLAIGLFVWLILAYVIPTFEHHLLERKREMIRELTNSAWSMLDEYAREAQAGRLSTEEAQTRALQRLEAMRYGEQRKDYFWVTDMQPKLLMHPYRPELVGTDVSGFTDPNGVRLFEEFVKVVRRQGHGYVDYVWQWKDDPERLAPKESYVRGFEPWGWVLGTGLYMEDVRAEIGRLTERLVNASFFIFLIVCGLLAWVAHQSLRTERRRRQVEQELTDSHERYQALVEAAGEGTMMVLRERCTYSNRVMRQMLGCSAEQFALLDLDDVLPDWKAPDSELARHVAALEQGKATPAQVETRLVRRDGQAVDVLLALTRVHFADQDGWIVNAKDIRTHKETEELLGESREKFRVLTQNIPLGVFRVDLAERGRITELNEAAARILGRGSPADTSGQRFFDFLLDAEDRDKLLRNLRTDGALRDRIVRLKREDGSMPVCSVSGVLLEDADGEPRWFDGIIEDITERKRTESERDAMMAQLQSSLLFLNEPIKHVAPDLVAVDMSTSIHETARRLAETRRSAVAVRTESGEVIGLVTESDITDRAVAASLDPSRPICEIMSAPIVSVPETALVYEALLLLQERGFRHVAVRNAAGRVTGLIQNKELMQFHRYSATIVTMGIRQAHSVQEVAALRRRTPQLVKMLIDCGARSRHITRIVTAVSDATVERLIELAIEELGPPPAPFAFLALGSEGREEQTLATDQDNAIVWADQGQDAPAIEDYFARLGARVCDGLAEAGIAYCRADTMARNPKWRQPLSVWKRYFSEWIHTDDPRDFLDINIFFDYRCVHGDAGLVEALTRHIQDETRHQAAFFHHFAQTVLLYKPPVGLFGQILLRSQGDAPRTFDIKAAMTPIVNFARIYALRHHLDEVNTNSRLRRLAELGVLNERVHEEMRTAYDYLMQMRLAHQARALADGREANNAIPPREMTALDETMVKKALEMIGSAQKQISTDFLGRI